MVDDSAEKRVGKGTVFVKAEICKGCAYCIEFCPADCLRFSHNYNAKGYHYPVLAKPESCVGCNTCGQFCPDYAIFGMRFKDIDAIEAARKAGTGNVEGGSGDGNASDASGRVS